MRPELTGCIQLPTGTVKLELTPATQALIWRCHFSPLPFVFCSLSFPISIFFSLFFLLHFLLQILATDVVAQCIVGKSCCIVILWATATMAACYAFHCATPEKLVKGSLNMLKSSLKEDGLYRNKLLRGHTEKMNITGSLDFYEIPQEV